MTSLLFALFLLGRNVPGVVLYYESQIRLFLWINAQLSGWPMFWRNVTELGDALVIFPFFSFLIYRNPRIWAAMFAAIPLSGLLSSLGKQLASVPRPAAVLAHDQFAILGNTLTAHNSLPSGHTITVFAVVTVIVGSLVSVQRDRHGRRWILAGFFFAAIVGVSRVAVGGHWPFDVVVGACFGVLGGASGIVLARHAGRCSQWLRTRWARGVWGVLMLSWGLVLRHESMENGQYDLIVPWSAAHCAVAVGSYLMYLALLPSGASSESASRTPKADLAVDAEARLKSAWTPLG